MEHCRGFSSWLVFGFFSAAHVFGRAEDRQALALIVAEWQWQHRFGLCSGFLWCKPKSELGDHKSWKFRMNSHCVEYGFIMVKERGDSDGTA